MEPPQTILLIEDDQDLRKLLRDHLEKLGHWVVATPGERLPGLFQIADSVDLIVVDVTVPDSVSLVLAEDLLARRRNLILITTDDTEFEVRQRFKEGHTHFLLKPFTIPELRDCVSQALRPRWAAAIVDAGKRFRPSAGPFEAAGFRRYLPAFGLAAAVLIVLLSGVLLSGPNDVPPLPQAVEDGVVRGEAVRILEPRGDLPVMPERLRWEEHAEATSYRIRILSVGDTIVWEGIATANEIQLAPQALAKLHAGVIYFWTVEALDARGELRARSQTARFQVVPWR